MAESERFSRRNSTIFVKFTATNPKELEVSQLVRSDRPTLPFRKRTRPKIKEQFGRHVASSALLIRPSAEEFPDLDPRATLPGQTQAPEHKAVVWPRDTRKLHKRTFEKFQILIFIKVSCPLFNCFLIPDARNEIWI